MGQVNAENGCRRNQNGKGRPDGDGLGEDQKLIGGSCSLCEREGRGEFKGRRDERADKCEAENQECGEEHEQTEPDRIRPLDLVDVEPPPPQKWPLLW